MGERRHRGTRARAWSVAAVLVLGVVALVVWQATSLSKRRLWRLDRLAEQSLPIVTDSSTESRINAFCGDCHAMPRPSSFPRDRWHDGVRLGYEYYARSGRTDLDPPPIQSTVDYFRSLAPETFVFSSPADSPSPFRAPFTMLRVDWPRNTEIQPAISHLRWTRLDADGPPVLVVCDMREGSVAAVDLRGREPRRKVLARLNHPCHVEACDLDGNGQIDLVVTDLGSFYAIDHDQGRVVWLRPQEGSDAFDEIVIASGLGRVADARPGDIDGDGDLDLVVAEFGHYRTGGILLLRNNAGRGEPPRFDPERIDSRPGTIHVPLCDFDGNGELDFAALVSQEYESLELFLNQGNAPFHRHTVWAAPDLSFGSSGIELVDMNQDGRIDILYTNGDSFDNLYANPSHGVEWLENLGDLDFAYHRLADMPGAYRAMAGDFDRDGDLDVIVASWLPRLVMPPALRETRLTSLLLLEQTSPGSFVRHTLETGSPHHAAMEMADFDGDGDLDFAVGMHAGLDDAGSLSKAPLAVWWNQTVSHEK